jgi:hypothetical protein
MERDVRIVTDDPAVVARRDVEEVAGLQYPFRAVVHPCDRLAAEYETDVLDLTGGAAHDRRDVLRPAPTRFVCRSTDDRRPDAVNVEPPLLEVARLAWRVEVE